jgi:hypothetical protein
MKKKHKKLLNRQDTKIAKLGKYAKGATNQITICFKSEFRFLGVFSNLGVLAPWRSIRFGLQNKIDIPLS